MRKRDQDRALRRAAKLIRKGWMQHTFQHNDCYCAMGALNAQTGYKPGVGRWDNNAIRINTDTDQLYKRFADYIDGKPHVLGHHSCFEVIEAFNDYPGQTASSVARALECAANA